jgi:hypothetical protein
MSKGRYAPPPPPLAPADRIITAEAAQAIAQRPGLWMQLIEHDADCKAGQSQRWADCTCNPDVRLVHYNDLVRERR